MLLFVITHFWAVLYIYKMLKHTEGNRGPEVLDLEDIGPGMRFSAEQLEIN